MGGRERLRAARPRQQGGRLYPDLAGGLLELRERMEREHIRVFVIDSSLGLCGFVLAQEVELKCP